MLLLWNVGGTVTFFFNRSCFNWSPICEGSDSKGFLPRQLMVSSDSHVLWCALSKFVLDRRWLWPCRNSGKHPKIHHATVFLLLLALLFQRSCEVLICQCPCVPSVCSLEEMGWQSILPLVQALERA